MNESLPERGLHIADVLHVLEHVEDLQIDEADEGTAILWKIYGPIVNGTTHAVVVDLAGEPVIVVTIHPPP